MKPERKETWTAIAWASARLWQLRSAPHRLSPTLPTERDISPRQRGLFQEVPGGKDRYPDGIQQHRGFGGLPDRRTRNRSRA
jgi:hypothetical protein